MRDFFISYTGDDVAWARWLAWVLEEAGYTTLFQDRDMKGNFVAAMRDAMANTRRTIGVLSKAALNSPAVQVEWQGAFRREIDRHQDPLVLYRVHDGIETDPWLAQHAYVDVFGVDEAAARHAVLERVAPSVAGPAPPVPFPSAVAIITAKRNVPQHPPFPAAAQDAERLDRVRGIARAWRADWATQVGALRDAMKLAQAVYRHPPLQPDAMQHAALALGAAAATALERMPLGALADAGPYGLQLHPNVLNGTALGMARNAPLSAERHRVVDSYTWENVGRVLESALALATFDLGRLPQGHLKADALPTNLAARAPLVLLRRGGEPGLLVAAPQYGTAPLGRLVARSLELFPEAARLNGDGLLDVVASDSESLHGWWGSAAQPTHQVECGHLVIAGAFAGTAPDAPALLVDEGGVRWFGPGVDRRQPLKHGIADVEKAALWIAASDPTRWRAVFVGREGECASAGPSGEVVTRDLWPEAVFGEVPWNSYTEVGNGRIDGFDCMVIWRLFEGSHGVCFLDPETLAPLREPLKLPRNGDALWIDLVLAGGRWLIATAIRHKDGPRAKLTLYDMGGSAADVERPAAHAIVADGDLSSPVVLAADGNMVDLACLLQRFDGAAGTARHSIVRWRWPGGQQTTWIEGDDLRLWAVDGSGYVA